MMKVVKRAAVLLGVAFLSTANAAEALPEDFVTAKPQVQLYLAYAEFKMANYSLAQAMWQHVDGVGKAEALFNLGILHEQGKGVESNLEQALDYYLQSAEAGSRAGAYQVGVVALAHPELVSADTARHWLMIAALDGDEDAGELLRTLDNSDTADPLISVKRLLMRGDSEQAFQQLVALSEQNPPDYAATTELAWLYETGLGVERNLQKAAELFTIAAEAGDPKAQYALSVMYATGAGKPVDMTESRAWLMLSAAQDYQPAVRQLSAQ